MFSCTMLKENVSTDRKLENAKLVWTKVAYLCSSVWFIHRLFSLFFFFFFNGHYARFSFWTFKFAPAAISVFSIPCLQMRTVARSINQPCRSSKTPLTLIFYVNKFCKKFIRTEKDISFHNDRETLEISVCNHTKWDVSFR
jgi:hypothetical protein